MNNEDYWKERFEQLENSTHNRSVRTVQSIDKELQKAQKTIEDQINAWYQRVAKNNDITMKEARKLLTAKELKEFKWDVQEYIKYGRENELDARWLKELENASARVHISRLEQIKLQTQQACEALYGNQLDEIDHHIRQVYQSDYYHTLYEVQRGINVGWNVASVDENMLSKIISKPWAVDGKNFSDRIWGSKSQLINSLHTNITQMCMLGQSPDKAIRNIEKVFGSSRSQASRLIMTESAYFSSIARNDAFKELDVEEFEVVATMDSHTSEKCRDMDGQHFPMSEFIVGVSAPPFHPNCRTTTCPYFADDEGTRVARDENGNRVYVPSNMTYREWKGNFVGNVAKATEEMKVIDFTPAKTVEEAEEYAKQFVNSGGFTIGKRSVNYSGVDLDVANDVNYQLTQLFGNYDIKKFDSIETFGKAQKKYWSNHGEAPLCTSNFGNLMINKEICKSGNTIKKYIADGKESFDYVMKNMSKLSGSKLELAKTYQKAGRSLVGETFKDMITHETGHHISYMSGVNKEISEVLKTSDWTEYATHLSGYANHSSGEYIAESWTAYIKGETELLDRKLIDVFERLVK